MYSRLLQRLNLHRFSGKALVVNCVNYGTILTFAEFTQQKIERWRSEKLKSDLDFKSLGKYALLGSTVISPMLYTYYCWLDTTFPGYGWRPVVIKILNDVLFANIAYYSAFYYGMSFLDHCDHDKAKRELKASFGNSYLLGMLFWIPVMGVNFRFVSPTFRVFFIACATFVEMNGLCLMRRLNKDQVENKK